MKGFKYLISPTYYYITQIFDQRIQVLKFVRNNHIYVCRPLNEDRNKLVMNHVRC